MTRAEERAGLAFAALCAANGAFVPAVAKLTTDRADALFVAAATTFFAGATALVVLAARCELALLVHPRIGPRLLAVGALGTGAAFWFFFQGARRATAIETVLCLQIEPAYALAAAWVVLGERPTARRLGAIALLLVGIALALGFGGAFAPAGVWLLLATPLCWQLSHLIVVRALRGVPPAVLTGARYAYGAVVLGLAWALGGATIGLAPGGSLPALLPALVVQGVVLSYVGTIMWYGAIARLDLARTTAIVVPSIPLLSLVATFVLLGERPTLPQSVGVVLTAIGVLGFVTAPHAIATRARVPTWTAPLAALRARRRR
ncbi:MAG: DMT family transporter [Deltaproteobacteria bacterium]|nr:DMT family transporter [Deltaproteobacteria bacterium]